MKNKNLKKRWIIILSILFVLIVLAVLAFFRAEYAMEKIVHSNKEVSVPDVTGLKFDEAKLKIKKEKLVLEKDSEVFDKKTKPGRIVSQFPQQNSIVRQGRTIKVVLSKGGNGSQMPSVIGIDQREAEAILKNAGLIIGQEESLYSTDVQAGKIIDQNPKPFAIISRGLFVNLQISKGSPPEGVKLMPNVIGLKKDVAEILLTTIGITVNFDFVPASKSEDKGIVVSQSPSMNQEITSGESVNIKIGA
jgi:serine/threonine-protein kinase